MSFFEARKMAEIIDYASLKKGGFMRQKQKGKFSLRLGIVAGHLDAKGLATVAKVAEKYGHGYVHMTSRQGIEIPFIDFKEIAEVKEELLKGGMDVHCDNEECIKCGVCVKACRENAITLDKEKGITLDVSKCNNCGRCVKSCPTGAWKGESGFIVSFGGLFGNKIYEGENIVPFIKDENTLFRVTDAAINWFGENGKTGERLRFTLQRLCEDDFRKKIQAAYNNEEVENTN